MSLKEGQCSMPTPVSPAAASGFPQERKKESKRERKKERKKFSVVCIENPTTPRSLGGNTKTCLNWPQTDERRKQGFHEKVEFDW